MCHTNEDINNRDDILMKMKDCNTVICKKYKFGHSEDQNIFFIYIFGLYPQFLDYSSPNPWNFLSHKSNENFFSHYIWSPVLNSGNRFGATKVK